MICIYIIKRVLTMYVPTFWLCLLTDFRAKYTYGLLMTQGVSEKYKIADFQEKNFFEEKNWVSKPLFVRTSVCPNLCLSELWCIQGDWFGCLNFDAFKERIFILIVKEWCIQDGNISFAQTLMHPRIHNICL